MIFDEGSYLDENWNKLDFLLVIASVATNIFPVLNLGWVNTLRVGRVLRILRNDDSNVKMKVLVITFLDSLAQIFKTIFIIFIVFFVISIFGVALLKD